MKTEDFELLSGLLKRRSGLVISKDKLYLLESRLVPLARERGMNGLDDLVSALRRAPEEQLLADVTEAMTTNESSFFRDINPFDNFRDAVLPELFQSRAGTRSIRIWSAACSTGQEPYSLAMLLRETAAKIAGWRVEIFATDLSTEVMEKAKVGLYSQFEVQRGLPIQLLVKYFSQVNEMWQIDPSIRAMAKFQPHNLLDTHSPPGAFDVVFCRNVLIYFDQQTKGAVLQKISRAMPSDGFLFLGGAETVLGISDAFKPMEGRRGMYRLTPRTKH